MFAEQTFEYFETPLLPLSSSSQNPSTKTKLTCKHLTTWTTLPLCHSHRFQRRIHSLTRLIRLSRTGYFLRTIFLDASQTVPFRKAALGNFAIFFSKRSLPSERGLIFVHRHWRKWRDRDRLQFFANHGESRE